MAAEIEKEKLDAEVYVEGKEAEDPTTSATTWAASPCW